jgi:hypothetical protein
MYFGPACNPDLSDLKNTTRYRSTLQTVLAAPMKDTISLQLSLFWHVKFWPKEGQNLISSLLYNFCPVIKHYVLDSILHKR